ncbi:MAG: heme ABC exporter ATP-binding protein CcmA [Rhodobacteraceae bacterium]|nr:heme ABC exporter ATP-binding protein CcmA [Paracoccaceae bacterium]
MSLEDVACARGLHLVLANVTFSVRAGECVVLRGPNGAGKTTLLRTIAGLRQPESGTITVAGDDLIYASHADGVKLAMTVAENLEFWSKIHGGPPIDDALARMELTPLVHRVAQNLSAGQRRHLGLARLLVAGCRLWIMDEPTVWLDQAAVAVFSRIVAAHLARGGSALAATHIGFAPDQRTINVLQFAATGTLRTGFEEPLP